MDVGPTMTEKLRDNSYCSPFWEGLGVGPLPEKTISANPTYLKFISPLRKNASI